MSMTGNTKASRPRPFRSRFRLASGALPAAVAGFPDSGGADADRP